MSYSDLSFDPVLEAARDGLDLGSEGDGDRGAVAPVQIHQGRL